MEKPFVNRFLYTTFLLIILSSCKFNLNSNNTENNTFSPDTGLNIGIPAESSKNNLLLSIQSNYQAYISGETALITVTVENQSDAVISLLLTGGGAPSIDVSVNSKLKGNMRLRHPDESRFYNTALEKKYLNPGEIITREVYWDLSIGENIVAPDGYYTITSSVLITDEFYQLVSIQEVATEIEVSTGLTYITPLTSLAVAYEDQSLFDWYQTNNYEKKCLINAFGEPNIVMFEGSKAFYSTESINEDNEESTPTIPGCNFLLIEGPYWTVNFSNQFGNIAGYFSYKIDAISATIIDSTVDTKEGGVRSLLN